MKDPSAPPLRLNRRDWVSAGLDALEAEGFPAVRADALARRLGVSRGSFYWHFANVAAFEEALIARWREMVLGALDEAPPKAEDNAIERFRTIIRRSLLTTRRLETAFRAWASVNPRVATALRRVDANREAYLTKLLARPDRSDAETLALARIAYWTYLGRAVSTPPQPAEADAIVDALVALVTRGNEADAPIHRSGSAPASTPPTRSGAA